MKAEGIKFVKGTPVKFEKNESGKIIATTNLT